MKKKYLLFLPAISILIRVGGVNSGRYSTQVDARKRDLNWAKRVPDETEFKTMTKEERENQTKAESTKDESVSAESTKDESVSAESTKDESISGKSSQEAESVSAENTTEESVSDKSSQEKNVSDTHGTFDSGYVDVRPDAHMFWWLIKYGGEDDDKEIPLIIWLAGGPGHGSSGVGNLYEIGPLDPHMKPRNYSWLDKANLLFVDQPVGSGYSYADISSSIPNTSKEVSSDFVAFCEEFFEEHTEFKTNPLYLFGHSYGAKLAVPLALDLHKAMKDDKVECNLKGVVFLSGWISPIDYILNWAQYLHSFSLVDEAGHDKIQELAEECSQLVEDSDFSKAVFKMAATESEIFEQSDDIEFNNVLLEDSFDEVAPSDIFENEPEIGDLYLTHVLKHAPKWFSDVMNNEQIKGKLKVPDNVTWGGQEWEVFGALHEEIMMPVVEEVDELLENDIEVVVVNGQLDLMTNVLGTNAWLQKLQWTDYNKFNETKRVPFKTQNLSRAGFVKSSGKLTHYYILNAGHMIVADAPEASLKMLDMILNTNHKP